MPNSSLYSWMAENKTNMYDIDFKVEKDSVDLLGESSPAPSTLPPCGRTTSDAPFGFRTLPWTRHLSIFCSLKWAIVLMSICIVAQEAAQAYFNRTVDMWKTEYGLSKELVDWLIVGSALFQGVFSVFIVHASIKQRRMMWISASVILLGVSCISLQISEVKNPLGIKNGQTIKDYYNENQLCLKPRNSTWPAVQAELGASWLGLITMVLFQFALAVCTTCLYVHGTVFIDDNESVENSILYIGAIMAMKQLGPSIGRLLSWVSVSTQGTHIFGTPVWIGLTVVLFIAGGFLGMFPNFLSLHYKIKNVVRSSDTVNKQNLLYFFKSICQNNVVFLNILCALFFWAAISNFELLENEFNQAKFVYPDEALFYTPHRYQAVIAFVKPLILFVAVICTASCIASNNIRTFHLALWNSLVPALLMLVYLVYTYLGCTQPHMTMTQSPLLENYCPLCHCEMSKFEPVCVALLRKTFFSPCYAGCTGVIVGDGYLTYTNCTCVTPLNTPYVALSGTCEMESCYHKWLTNDLLQLWISGSAVTILMTSTVISLYSVHYSERSYALAVQMGVVGLFGFGTIRSIYLIVTNLACRYLSPSTGSCRLLDYVHFGRYDLTLTLAFLLLSSCCGLQMARKIRQQTTNTPDLIRVQARGHRRRPSMNSSDLINLMNYSERSNSEPDTTPLVFSQFHTAKRSHTMETILEVDEEELLRSDEEEEDDVFLETMSTDDEEAYDNLYVDVYDDTTPFLG